MVRKILLITERRADYSRFKPILNEIKKDKDLKFFLLVTGLHLIKSHGFTINEIKKDFSNIACSFPNFKNNKIDSAKNMINALAITMNKVSLCIEKFKPDIILSGFDIGANFALTVVGAHYNIPIAHIQGGEVTGSIDESLRHSMSKFSNYHLVANIDAKNRLIKMGEKKENIFIVGCPSLDALFNEKDLSKKYLQKKFNIDFNKKVGIVIQHPVTSENNESKSQIKKTIKAIKKTNLDCLFILPNNDFGHKAIIDQIKKNKLKWVKTLSLREYKSLLKHSSILIGNSSSGIHEAASFKTRVVNIGSRQNGRLKASNVIDAQYNSDEILKKIRYTFKNKSYLKALKKVKNPYGDGKSSKKIIRVLKKINLKLSTQKINTY